MTMYDGVILTFILVGIIIIIVSFVLTKYERFIIEEENKKLEKRQDDQIDYDEVRNKILELNEYGEYLKAELDKKHKELLFLYQMIIEKQKEIQIDKLEQQVGISNADNNYSNKKTYKDEIAKNEVKSRKINYNKEILDMSLAGYSPEEVARKLKIGKGQVELVLNLYK